MKSFELREIDMVAMAVMVVHGGDGDLSSLYI